MAIREAGQRRSAGDFQDEAASAYSGNRGRGLASALREAERLARLEGGCELWVQHSDRLARGDGKRARHVVELALWANRTGVTIRSLQDPDTFRDLLYAVVTGQRNHLDSQRKGASVRAGLRRSAARGVYSGVCLDGYEVVVNVRAGRVEKHLGRDPARAPLIERVFELALGGEKPWDIAQAVNAEGWRTTGGTAESSPKLFEAWGILRMLNNPRYAGLSPWNGEVLGPAEWPAFIAPEAFATLRERRAREKRPDRLGPQPRQPYLLIGVARCGMCGAPIHAITGRHSRADGTRARRYLCSGRRNKHCEAWRIRAVPVDIALVKALPDLLDPAEHGGGTDAPPRAEDLKLRIGKALTADDLHGASALLEELRTTLSHPEGLESGGVLSAEIEQYSALGQYKAWAAASLDHPDRIPITTTKHLRKQLKTWFHRVELTPLDGGCEILPVHRDHRAGETITVSYDTWRMEAADAGYPRPPQTGWTRAEIIHAAKQWTLEHGAPPRSTDWPRASSSHPMYSTLFREFGDWLGMIHAAGYAEPRPERPHKPRKRETDGRIKSV